MDVRSAIATGMWGICVCVGTIVMVRYQLTPGSAATPPKAYLQVAKSPKANLMVFLHPQCACSRATVSELSKILTLEKGAFQTTLYFYRPSKESDSWCKETNLWHEANRIPGTTLKIDSDGKIAKSFGARCSGQVLLYSADVGKLVFSGGITSSRGNEGESVGEDVILQYAHSGKCSVPTTPVYGCAIWSDLDANPTVAGVQGAR